MGRINVAYAIFEGPSGPNKKTCCTMVVAAKAALTQGGPWTYSGKCGCLQKKSAGVRETYCTKKRHLQTPPCPSNSILGRHVLVAFVLQLSVASLLRYPCGRGNSAISDA